ncbi:MAG: hypothetical protein U0746_02895 [Gemmataceae bacterium]
MQKVQMTLVGIDGNAFSILGAFRRNARNQGWPQDAIDAVTTEAMRADYTHLLSTIMDATTPGIVAEEYDEDAAA